MDLDRKRKAVQQLRAQVAFFGVHRADQDKARRVGKGDAFALDDVDAHGGRIEQQVDDMIVQQVDFIDIQQAAVGGSQHARLEVALALLDGFLDIQGAHHPVFGGADRQVDKADAGAWQSPVPCPRFICSLTQSDQVFGALGSSLKGESAKTSIWGSRAAMARAAVDLAGAALAADQHAADAWVDSVQHQGAFHALLAYNGSKWINWRHYSPQWICYAVA